MTALRVSLLASAGRIAEAEHAWKAEGLPEQADGCLDLTGRNWREMEALSCARLRLTIGSERFGEGRGFAGELRALAEARGLKRTLMRSLALSAVLERCAGDAATATAHVNSYLRACADTPYMWPLVRERADCAVLLAACLETAPGPPVGDTAGMLLEAMERADDPPRWVLSEREWQVLQRLGKRQDKQIAAELGLSAHGVRYHLRKLFAKLGARDRVEAVRRAREMGLVLRDP